ncbi:succinylglutamate desuccinylase [Ectothiorhodospiraceae bacterium BW-2]|nr:succinylglutamate desuccinylase [Ectothiorhodospiraceae bacterium BW-2]
MPPLTIAGHTIGAGERLGFDLPIAQLHTHTPLRMPVQVRRGKRPGPALFISAAIHGDELNGVEIIRRLQQQKVLSRLSGTLITIPVVNVFGLIHHSRYLPDRRDLNRSFPGSERGSLAARLANIFMREIVDNCSHGIDLHTGAVHRSNLPQIRVNLDHDEALGLAHAFGVPVILGSDLRDGSLRQEAAERGIPMLLYEAGEALRFDELSIRAGVKGVLNVMRELGMLPKSSYRSKQKPRVESLVARASSWVRAPESGVFRAFKGLGQWVEKREQLGIIDSPFGDNEQGVVAPMSGLIIGKTNLPLVNEGDALFHIARFDKSEPDETVELFTETLVSGGEANEPPII